MKWSEIYDGFRKYQDAFEESKHPRDPSGKFGSGGSEGGSKRKTLTEGQIEARKENAKRDLERASPVNQERYRSLKAAFAKK